MTWLIRNHPAIRAAFSLASLAWWGILECCKPLPVWMASCARGPVLLAFRWLLANSPERERVLILCDGLRRSDITLALPLNMSAILTAWRNCHTPTVWLLPFNLTAHFAEIATTLRSSPPPSVAPSIIRPDSSLWQPGNTA